MTCWVEEVDKRQRQDVIEPTVTDTASLLARLSCAPPLPWEYTHSRASSGLRYPWLLKLLYLLKPTPAVALTMQTDVLGLNHARPFLPSTDA
jgi:hypothetical protein